MVTSEPPTSNDRSPTNAEGVGAERRSTKETTMLHECHLPERRKAFSSILAGSCCAILSFQCPIVHADVSTPDTPAGRTLQAFLQAFNASDNDRIAAYISQFDPKSSVDRLMSFSSQTGGFALTSIVQSAPDKISFVVHGRRDNVDSYGILQLASVSPPLVKRLSIRGIPLRESVDDIPLDATQRKNAIKAISAQLTDFYVYPDAAAKMVRRRCTIIRSVRGIDYNAIVDWRRLRAEAISEKDLRAVNNDRHLSVAYNPFTSSKQADAAGAPHPDPAEEARFRSTLEHQNCTFSKLEILNHNIGYIRFDSFPPPEFCGSTVVAAMNFLAHTDALIFDLRENHGGDPDMVDFIVSYLFREPTHINDLTNSPR